MIGSSIEIMIYKRNERRKEISKMKARRKELISLQDFNSMQ